MIRFFGMNEDIPQMTILSDNNNPLEGDSILLNSTT
jgi:hypothetical protein